MPAHSRAGLRDEVWSGLYARGILLSGSILAIKSIRWSESTRGSQPRIRNRGDPCPFALVVKAGIHRASSIKVADAAKVIDCHGREVIGYELALQSRANEAERAIEAACFARFGTLRPTDAMVFAQRQWADPPESAVSASLMPFCSCVYGVMNSLNASFGRSKKRVFGSTRSRHSMRHGGLISGERYG